MKVALWQSLYESVEVEVGEEFFTSFSELFVYLCGQNLIDKRFYNLMHL